MKRLLSGIWVAGLMFAGDLDRGIELYKQGKYSEAESELRTVVAENEINARARRFLGLAMLEEWKFDEAAG